MCVSVFSSRLLLTTRWHIAANVLLHGRRINISLQPTITFQPHYNLCMFEESVDRAYELLRAYTKRYLLFLLFSWFESYVAIPVLSLALIRWDSYLPFIWYPYLCSGLFRARITQMISFCYVDGWHVDLSVCSLACSPACPPGLCHTKPHESRLVIGWWWCNGVWQKKQLDLRSVCGRQIYQHYQTSQV